MSKTRYDCNLENVMRHFTSAENKMPSKHNLQNTFVIDIRDGGKVNWMERLVYSLTIL